MNSFINNNNEKENIMQIESKKICLADIKSTYILKKVFDKVRNYTKFEIIRYNKNLQKKLNIDISQYKKFSTIEIEVIPAENKFGNFINFNNKKQKNFYHIYFNDSEKEINRNYISENDKIDKIKIIINFQVDSFYKLFSYCDCIESITFKNFYRKNINNMSFMFYKCTSLKEINFMNYITLNVENMSCMFFECFLLNQINLSNFDTEKVTDMSYMFHQCTSLRILNAPNLNTENVTNMREMFFGCSNLREININSFNTESINNENSVRDIFKNSSIELKEKMRELTRKNRAFNLKVNYYLNE